MATFVSEKELRRLSEQAQAFPPEAAERQLSAFLPLAPTTSASYPSQTAKPQQQQQQQQQLELPPPVTPAVLPAEAVVVDASADQVKRRASSVGSSSSDGGGKSPVGFRFLRLGPVHWGEHPGDNKSDWHEAAVE
ncbi:hypothetical protein QBC33DRAFT_76721 [Phialemonium atrogriseum]|uniref:Uncharacterized protein n=1 Tax=Phialemonium atrogriseum TaxID=1093897 RepID=A0AAJ0FL80_9PEZI|nr:uncharacterized protein QBC33DRAFT_76721 [Phialemonium atrogriseum]KAK1767083.1 hypothetical protein QBC33DRAFT_76721 [Phialemonium atrogriseum]